MPGIDIPRMGLPDRLTATLSMGEQHDLLRVRRRTLLGGALATAVAYGSPAWAVERLPGKHVIPFGRHLAWGASPRTQVRVGWQVPHPVTRPFLRLGDTPWSLGGRIDAEIRPLHSEVTGAIAAVDQYYLHAALDGLRPGTTYYYAVGHDDFDPADLTRFGRIDSFKTAPTRHHVAGRFTFTAFGDQGVSSHALRNGGTIAAQGPAFHLHAGDLCYADASGKGRPVSADGAHGTDIFDPRKWDQFWAQNEAVAASVPWMACLGNHDMEALYSPDGYGGQLARWDFPANGPAKGVGVYSFIYGNVGVVALDANDITFETTPNRGYTGGAQTRWLDGRLEFLREQQDVDFIVVFFHHCAYSTTSSHASEGGVRNLWVPLFDKYAVDLVINGHNHVYERADTMKGGVARKTPIGDTVHPETDGTTYITAGGGGRGLYAFSAPDTYAGHEQPESEVASFVWAAGAVQVEEKVTWSRVRYTGYSFLAVDADPAHRGNTTTLTLRALTENGTEIDRLVIARTAGGGHRHQLDDDNG